MLVTCSTRTKEPRERNREENRIMAQVLELFNQIAPNAEAYLQTI